MLANLSLHHLQVFHAVVNAGTIVGGAQHLGLSAATVSEHMASLTERIGQPLLTRQGRKIVPTPIGDTVFQHAEAIAEQLHLLGESLSQKQESHTRPLHIGLTETLSKRIAWNIIQPITQGPQSRRILCHEDRLDGLLATLAIRKLDFIIADEPLPSGVGVRAVSRLLGRSSIGWFGHLPKTSKTSKSHHKSPGKNWPQSLAQHPLLLPTRDTPLRRRLDAWFANHHITPTIIAECSDSSLLKTAGGSGAGIFPAPRVLHETLNKEFGVSEIGPCTGVEERYYLITPEQFTDQTVMQSLLEASEQLLEHSSM